MIATGQDITAADLATLAALANFKLAPGTAYVFGASSNDWLTQFNRIRTDLYAKIFDDDTSPIYQSTAALVSDPQCVGINPCPQVADNGKLYLGDALNAMPATGWFPLFKGIKFLYAAIDEDFTFGNPDINFSIPYLTMATTAAALFWGVKYPGFAPGFTDTGSAPNRTFSHTFNYVSPVAATLWLVIQIPLTTGGFDTKTIVQAVAAGSGSVVFSSTGDYNGVPVITSAEFFWPGTTSEAAATVIHPGSAGKQLTLTDIASANFLFTLDTVRGCPFVTVNLPSLRGMWLASTLPTPALNVFLDVDFPPYVQRVIGSEFAGSITPITDGDLHGYWYHRGRSVGTALDWSFVMMDPGNTEMALNPRTSLRQPSPTLPNLTLEFPYDIVALAINANYSGSILFPDDITLHCYGGSANTGVDPLVVTTVVLPIYVSRTPNIDPANPATYGFVTTNGQVKFADVRAYYDGSTDALTADGRTLYFLVHNNSGAAIATLGVIWEEYLAFLIRPVEPGITTQPAVWPVMRDTDDYPWFSGLDPYRSLRGFGAFTLPAGTQHSYSTLISSEATQKDYKFTVSPVLPIYVSRTAVNPANPATYDFMVTTGTVTFAELKSQYGDTLFDDMVLFVCFNNGSSTVTVTPAEHFETFGTQSKFQQLPVFFPSVGNELDPANQIYGVSENFSNFLSGGYPGGSIITGIAATAALIPQRGYVIYSVLVRRQPKLTYAATAKNPSIYLPPTASGDLQALDVDVGFFSGLTHTDFEAIDKGTFNSLVTVTIPEGELEARVSVFWPVLYGTMLVYQSDDPVFVEALVNFQPVFHNKLFGDVFTPALATDASARYLVPACSYQNLFNYPSYVQFPMAAVIVTDLIAALNLL